MTMNLDAPQPDPAEFESPAEREAAYERYRTAVKEVARKKEGTHSNVLGGTITTLRSSDTGNLIGVLALASRGEYQVNRELAEPGRITPMEIFHCEEYGEVTKRLQDPSKEGLPTYLSGTETDEEALSIAQSNLKMMSEANANHELSKRVGHLARATVAEIDNLIEEVDSAIPE